MVLSYFLEYQEKYMTLARAHAEHYQFISTRKCPIRHLHPIAGINNFIYFFFLLTTSHSPQSSVHIFQWTNKEQQQKMKKKIEKKSFLIKILY